MVYTLSTFVRIALVPICSLRASCWKEEGFMRNCARDLASEWRYSRKYKFQAFQ
jgi:hypothetical protein